MEQKGTMLQWKLSLAETLSFGMTLIVLVYFIMTNFVTKTDGLVLEKRIERVEAELSSMRAILTQVANDLSYIRGRLEPKEK